MFTIGLPLAAICAMPWIRLVPLIGFTTKQSKFWFATLLSLSAWPAVSVIDAADWIVYLTPVFLPSSLMPSSMCWKNGLSRPLMTMPTLASLALFASDEESEPEEPQALSASAAVQAR